MGSSHWMFCVTSLRSEVRLRLSSCRDLLEACDSAYVSVRPSAADGAGVGAGVRGAVLE
jgi:hypothetical protein